MVFPLALQITASTQLEKWLIKSKISVSPALVFQILKIICLWYCLEFSTSKVPKCTPFGIFDFAL